MSEVWIRWRVALVPLGLALALIGVVWAVASSGPGSTATTSSAVVSASTPAPPAPPPTVAPPPPLPSATSSVAASTSAAPGSAAPDDASAPTITWRPVVHKEDLITRRSQTASSLKTTEDQLKQARADLVELERNGRKAAIARKRLDVERLEGATADLKQTIRGLDGEIAGAGP